MTGQPPGCLLVATTPRSGSWLLSDYLSQTGGFAPVREYFHVNYVAALSREYGLSTCAITGEYIAEIRRRCTGGGALFGAKIHWLQINQLVDALRQIHPSLANAPAPELIEASLPAARYIHLTRGDKTRQAISMFRAMRSDQWWELAEPPTVDSAGRSRPAPVPDYLAVRWFEDDLRSEDAEWRRYFDLFGIVPFTITYEELATEPYPALEAIFDWLEIPGLNLRGLRPRVRRQADAETERTLAEYLTLRDSLPPRPPEWRWSFRRRAFGLPDDDQTAGVPADVPPQTASQTTPI